MKSKPRYPAVALTSSELTSEAHRVTRMLKGKTLLKVWRHRPKEIVLEFSDQTRLFVDVDENGLEISIT